jgi:alpha-ketoglutarate-dependent 2,4-dichlorophenoxyacetate dioxygenase
MPMTLTFRRLHPVFAAETADVDIGQVPSAAVVKEIEAAMDRYAVLVLRGNPVSPAQQIAFTRAFGPLDVGFKRARRGQPDRLGTDELADISNLDETGNIAARNHRRIVGNIANALWHSDSSFQNPTARYSMLHAIVVPPKGGDTEFADLRAAYDALPADGKAEIASLKAEHSAFHSRLALGDSYTPEQIAALPPVQWPLARRHPSGRTALFVGAHVTHVVGMTVPEGRLLVSDLLEHATHRQFVYAHKWRVGDLVIWDNRATIHRGRRHDLTQRRELRRSTTLDAERELEPAAAR